MPATTTTATTPSSTSSFISTTATTTKSNTTTTTTTTNINTHLNPAHQQEQSHSTTVTSPMTLKSNSLNEEIRNAVAAVQFNDAQVEGEEDEQQKAYKDLIKQLAAQAPEPYGAIPPLLKKKKKKKHKEKEKEKRKDKDSRTLTSTTSTTKKGSSKKKKGRTKGGEEREKVPIRRMSHVENWLALDSKESIPDEEDLIPASPFQNFLSTDFLVLPLHMPPPSLSAMASQQEEEQKEEVEEQKRRQRQRQQQSPRPKKTRSTDLRPILYPAKKPAVQVIPIQPATEGAGTDSDEDEEEEEEDEDIIELDDVEDEEEDDEEEDEDEDEDNNTEAEEDSDVGFRIGENGIQMTRKTSIPSFSKSHEPSTSTTNTYAMSTSPPSSSSTAVSPHTIDTSSSTASTPHPKEPLTPPTARSSPSTSPSTSTTIKNSARWLETIAQLKRSLILSTSSSNNHTTMTNTANTKVLNNSATFKKPSHFIPMPPSPKPSLQQQQRRKRRSEATTQPRFNPETNTYTRDTRSNPDHLRMISAELNMMRHRKLSSPLKPRGFLPRRTDPFIRGDNRKLSNLKHQLSLL